MASWRPPGGAWRLPGRLLGVPGAPRTILERFWVPFGRPFGTPKRFKIDAKLESEIQERFGASIWSSGIRFGVDLGFMLGSFGALFCCPLGKHENLDF